MIPSSFATPLRMTARALLLCLAVVALLALQRLPETQGQSLPDQIRLRFLGFNVAAPGANANIITTAPDGSAITGLTAESTVAAFRLTVILGTTSVFNETVTDGTTTVTSSLNGGVALTAGVTYTFCHAVSESKPRQDLNATPARLAWNFQVVTNGSIRLLEVDEVKTGSM